MLIGDCQTDVPASVSLPIPLLQSSFRPSAAGHQSQAAHGPNPWVHCQLRQLGQLGQLLAVHTSDR